jgi:peptidoglycan/LPS O-acetylase OafA/YrhL
MIVVFSHFAAAFVPWLNPVSGAIPLWVVDTPLGILINGTFSVSVFFVLSGYVVSRAASRGADPLYVNVVLRYLRLALPSAASTVLAWGLLTSFPRATEQVYALLPHDWLFTLYHGVIPGIGNALYDGLAGVFLHGTSLWNGALWTMQLEAKASFAIYLVYALPKGRWRTLAGSICAIISLLRPYYLGFTLGGWILSRQQAGKPLRAPVWPTLACGVLLGFPAFGFSARVGLPRLPAFLTPGIFSSAIPQFAAALIFLAILSSTPIQERLSGPICRFLGQVSFPLYLVHLPLLLTVFAALYVRFHSPGQILILLLAFVATSLLLATLVEALVDRPILEGIAWIRRRTRKLSLPLAS